MFFDRSIYLSVAYFSFSISHLVSLFSSMNSCVPTGEARRKIPGISQLALSLFMLLFMLLFIR